MRYLIGELSEDDKTRIEEAFFADDSKFEAIELAEDELIDAYVRKELSPEELRRFKANLLGSPRLVERVNFASALAEKADSVQTREATALIAHVQASEVETTPRWWMGFLAYQPKFGMAMAAYVMLVLVAGSLLISGWLRLRSESVRLANERATLQRQKEELDKQSAAQRAQIEEQNALAQRARDERPKGDEAIEQPKDTSQSTNRQPSATAIAMVLLRPGAVRSGDGVNQDLVIRPETTTAQLRLLLDKNGYATYNVIIKTPEDTQIFQQSRVRPQNTPSGPQLVVSFRARRLPTNDYTVQVEGITSLGVKEPLYDYSFRVRQSE